MKSLRLSITDALDGFKRINDQFGHGQGGILLTQTILRSSLRDGDIAGRLGGDEFVVCISTPADILEQTAKRHISLSE